MKTIQQLGSNVPINLYPAGTLEDGTLRLQSQLYIGKDTADFILKDGVLFCWGNGEKGFNFYKYDEPYKII